MPNPNLDKMESFQVWARDRLRRLGKPPDQIAGELGLVDARQYDGFWGRRITIASWPAIAIALDVRFDELLVVIEHYHPDWMAEYRRLVTNTMRYLVTRIESNGRPQLFSNELARLVLEELLEPTLIEEEERGRRRRDRRKGAVAAPAGDNQRIGPRRLGDVIEYLKGEIAPRGGGRAG
jgi:hypothetical protein